MKFSKLFISTLLTAVFASDVVDLSKSSEDFNKFVGEHPVVLAKFFAPWCGHCKRLAPEYEVAAAKLKEKDIHLVEVDCTQNQELCAEHKIQGYPTLFVFKGLDSAAQYNGGRTSDEIVKYMERELLPSFTSVTADSLEDFKKSSPELSTLFLFDSSDSASNQTVSKFANAHHHEYAIGVSNDKSIADKLGVKKLPAAVIFSEYEDEPVVLNESVEDFTFDEDSILKVLMSSSIAPAGEISPQTFRAYMMSGLPMAYFFYSTPEEREKFSKAILPVAKELRKKINVGFIDASQFGSHAGNLNLDDKKFPSFSIHNVEKNLKYPISQDEKLSVEAIEKHLRDYVAGKLQPKVKSEEVPDVQEGPVYKAVGKNYENLVVDNDKDVLIEFYAPWCGHCKNLAPIYDELGGLFFGKTDKVVVAKMDHTANEIDVSIQGYPTIMLFAAGKKDSPIVYEGARTLEALNDFIKEKGTHGIDGMALKGESSKKKESAPKKKSKRSKKSKKAKKAKKDEL